LRQSTISEVIPHLEGYGIASAQASG
jgi:hypothetical protein